MKIVVRKDFQKTSLQVAKYIQKQAIDYVKEEGEFNIALAGGRTPRDAYRMLAELDLPWNKMSFFMGDERFVSVNDRRSNYLMVNGEIGNFTKIHQVDTSVDIRQSCLSYSRLLPVYMHLILLGIGPDGHTASLFQGCYCENVTDKVCYTSGPDGLQRVSLTKDYIRRAQNIAFFACGGEKRNALKNLVSGEKSMPAVQVVIENTTLFTDQKGLTRK